MEKDPLDGHFQEVSEKIRRRILLRSNIFPGILANNQESNMNYLTPTKASNIRITERVTGRKVKWQRPKVGD